MTSTIVSTGSAAAKVLVALGSAAGSAAASALCRPGSAALLDPPTPESTGLSSSSSSSSPSSSRAASPAPQRSAACKAIADASAGHLQAATPLLGFALGATLGSVAYNAGGFHSIALPAGLLLVLIADVTLGRRNLAASTGAPRAAPARLPADASAVAVPPSAAAETCSPDAVSVSVSSASSAASP